MDNNNVKKIAVIALLLALVGVGISTQTGTLSNASNMINIYQIYNLTAWNATFVNNSNISGTVIDFPMRSGGSNNSGFIDAGTNRALAIGVSDMPLEYNSTSGVRTNDTSNQSIITLHPGSVNTFASFGGNYTCYTQYHLGYTFGFGGDCSKFIQIESGIDPITGIPGEADLSGGLNMGNNPIYNSPTISYIWTTGVISGGNLTFYSGNGTIHIDEGIAMIRTGALQTDKLITVKFAAKDFTIVYGETKYIYLDFLSGVTQLKETPSVLDIHGFAQIQVYQTFLNDEFHYIDARGQNLDSGNKIRALLYDTNRFLHASGGSMIGTPGGLNLSVTSGRFYYGLNSITHTALNTSAGNPIEYYYHNSTGVWFSTQNTTINNAYYNPNGSGLVALLPLKYKTEFVYLTLSSDNTTEINVIYGQNSYTTLADAEAATIPESIPTELRDIGVLIGRIIVREGNPTLLSVESAFTTQFTPSSVSDHNSLANLQGGTAGEYYHLSSSIYTSVATYMVDFGLSVRTIMASTITQLQTNIDTKVNKSGDTMTGNLSFYDTLHTIKINSSVSITNTTINETGTGATTQTNNNGYVRYAYFIPSANATVNMLAIRVTSPTGNFRMAIYNTTGVAPYMLMNQTSSVALYQSGWNNISLSNTSLIAGTKYWIAIQVDSAVPVEYYSSGVANSGAYQLFAYGSFPTTATPTTDTVVYNMRSIYSSSVGEITWCVKVSSDGVLYAISC